MMQALELGTFATSNNRQWRHRQLQWARSKQSLIAMDAINAIIVKHQSTHETSVLLMSRGEPWQSHKAALPTNETKASWGRCEYHDNTHPAMTIIVKGASIAATQARQTQQPGGPLNRKPQADWAYSCLRSPTTRTSRTTIKHAMKYLQRNNKKCSHMTLAPRVTHATHALDEQCTRSTDAVPSDNKTSTRCDDNIKDTIYHLHFDKKIEGRLCCCGSPCKTDHQWPSRVKRAKRKRHFLHFWTTISNFTDTVLMGLD